MLETIKSQFESGDALIQSKNYHLSKRENWPTFYHDLYPMGQDYYSELNPYFTFNVHRSDLYNYAKTFFVRDGAVTFASFILKHYPLIPKLKTHYIIHPSLAPLVPPNYQQYFSCWHMVQPKKLKLENAKRVLIFGILAEQYLGNEEQVAEKLAPINSLHPDVEIDIYLPQRKDPFIHEWRETTLQFKVIQRIKETIGQRKINVLLTRDLMEKSMYNDYYLIDLACDNFTICDNYVNYLVASRGGTVGSFQETAPEDSQFKVALSFNHEVHITNFPQQVESVFTDLLFAKKVSSAPNSLVDPTIHAILRS